ncbi:putative pectin lyase C [Alternaria alternata]|nr:putative pectin lyase C [Alternaria alternata]
MGAQGKLEKLPTCGADVGSGAPTTTAKPTSTKKVTSTLVTKTKTSSAKATATKDVETDEGSSSGSVQLYGQCGGQGYSGPTTCASGKCVKSNEWYSQCQ